MHRFIQCALRWRGFEPAAIRDSHARFEKAYERLIREYDIYLLELEEEYTHHEWALWLLFSEIFEHEVDVTLLFGQDGLALVSSVRELKDLSNELRQSGHPNALIMVDRPH